MSDSGAIAIIGMGCRLPGADKPDQFWRNLRNGVESIQRLSAEELAAAGVTPEESTQPNYVPAKGLIDQADSFDAAFFGFSPRDAALMDPQQRVFLECAWSALEDAGYDGNNYPGPISVFAGSILSVYLLKNLWPNRKLMAGAGSFQTAVGNDVTFLASRTAYQLGLRGASISVGTACSTSLVAVHLACQSLLTSESDMALAGGVSIHLPLTAGYRYEDGGILSPDGHCRPFDASARGTVSSDGAGVVVLKRLDDALADQDTIHAVIRASAVNNDGSVKIGYTAPSAAGQSQVIAEALAMAGIGPEDISLVETHGAATPLGDPIEFQALTEAFGDCGGRRGFCALGAVKSNIGHVDAAAGIAGLLKATLALKHREIPATLHFTEPNPQIELNASPFFVNAMLHPMTGDFPLRAGVSSFGIGGTNAHIILEEAPQPDPESAQENPHELWLISARSAAALDSAAYQLADALEQHPEIAASDAASTLRLGRRSFEHRRALVASSRDEAIRLLRTPEPQSASTPGAKPGLVFLFPGLGDHYPQMGWQIYCAEPHFRATVDRCAEHLRQNSSSDLRDILFAGHDWRNPVDTATAPASSGLDLRAMLGRAAKTSAPDPPTIGQVAIFVIELALAELLRSWGCEPEAMIGHSIGEFVAAHLSGVMSLPDALDIVAARARLIETLAIPGAMLSVAIPEEDLLPLLPADVSLAAVNGPRLCVASGSIEGIASLESALAACGISTQKLRTTHAYHSRMMEPIAAPLAALLARIELHAPETPYVSCSTGTWITAAQATDPNYWASHLCHPVRFHQGLCTLLEEPGRVLLEVGPGQGLTSHAVRELARLKQPSTAIATMRWSYSGEAEMAVLLRAAGQLWVHGVSIDKTSLLAQTPRRRVPLPTYPFERQRFWIDPPDPGAQEVIPFRSAILQNLSDWFYLPYWKPSPIAQPTSEEALRGPWLIFADEGGVAEALAGRLRSFGQQVTLVHAATTPASTPEALTIDPNNPSAYEHLGRHLAQLDAPPARIVHLWSLTPQGHDEPSLTRFRDIRTRGYDSLMQIIRWIVPASSDAGLRIDIVANGLTQINGSETIIPEKACLRGPAIVAPQEHPRVACRLVDIPTTIAPADAAAHLLSELANQDRIAEVAYRNGLRWAQTWLPTPLPLVNPANIPYRHAGTYVITGGLGALGLVIAEHLARTANAKLALIGRSPLPPRDLWSQVNDPRVVSIVTQIQNLEARGTEVLILTVDVADEAAMQQAFATIEARLGQIHGIIHAAGHIGPGTFREIAESDNAQADAQFKSKVGGVLVLQKLLTQRNVDFCLLTSSLAAVLGGLGFAAYAAANAFLDAFAAAQTGSPGTRWVSVDWDSWKLDSAAQAVPGVGGTVSSFGMKAHEALEACDRILAQSGIAHVAVSTGNLQARLDTWVVAKAKSDAPLELHARPALHTQYQAPRSEIESTLAGIWEELFGITPIGIADNFFALGGHSLLATQLNARLYATLGVEISLAKLLQAPTIADLATAIVTARSESVDAEALQAILAEIEDLPLEEDDLATNRLSLQETGPGER